MDRRVVFVNAAYASLTGPSFMQSAGLHASDLPQIKALCDQPGGDAWLDFVMHDLPQGVTESTAYFPGDLLQEDGATRRRFWKLKASLLPSKSGAKRSDSFIAIRVSDVTKRAEREAAEQREKALLRSQAQLRNILASEASERLRLNKEQFDTALAFAKVGAWELDPSTGVIVCTDQCKLNLGLAPDDALTETRLFTELIATDDRSRVRAQMESALHQRQHFEAEYRLERSEGKQRWLLVRGQGKYDEKGLVSILGFTIDITGRKESELRQEQEVERERGAREQSERNVLAMDHFVSSVTHELRSPLGAIISWAELIERTQDPVHLRRAAESVKRNARHLSLMVDDLLDTGAIVSGKLSVRRETVDLEALTRELVDDLKSETDRKGLRLSCALSPCVVIGDESRLKQVLWNLLSNAVKFTHQGAIDVCLHQSAEWAEISIEDTGCGIAPDAMQRIFERFEQVRCDVAGRIGGLGLGLWLVQSLVELHGGIVEVTSPGVGKGSTFRVHLPLADRREISVVA
ncbi:PAS domain-containing sensor histidine kinase [Caballeronia sp. NCTM1]|uniref:PAS domain-containing sensor histidine kinase n=1 Tax=Caballeronia sp. NCTM1 TaxID=2921753 RepID=UPI0020294185|nr:PAS domain-containing sensor histidine kinase [Caballeronia sp. NCTM1]